MHKRIAPHLRRGPDGRFIAGKKRIARSNPSLPKRVTDLVRLGATEAEAKRLHRRMSASSSHEEVDAVLEDANVAIGGYGVEAIEGDWHDRYYRNIVALYVNKGDTYETTVLYDATRSRFLITSWGDFVERNGRRLGVE